MIFALLLVVLVGFAGLAIDVGNARVQAESAQHAADAAALAGVVFMPNDFASAQQRAMDVANSDGFTNTARTAVSVTPDSASPYRLDVTVNTTMTTTFLNILGLHTINVSRKAIAEFTTPIQLGSPDHVLGFGPYPTTAISNTNGTANTTAGETFYLETRGRYARKENGDAFSPWYSSESVALSGGGHYLLNSACTSHCGQPAASYTTSNNPCSTCASALAANPDNAANPGGLNFIFYVPPSLAHTQLAIKIMDPFDESQLSQLSTTVYDPAGHQVGTQYIDQSPSGSGSQLTCVPLNTAIYSTCNSNGQGSGSPTHDAPTTLQYTLFAPGQTSIDNSQPALPAFSYGSVLTTTNPYTYQVGPNPLIGGPDRDSRGLEVGTVNPATTPGYGVYAWRWVTLALVTGSGYYRLNIQPIQNSSYADLASVFNGTYGPGGNSYALGICTSDATAPFTTTDPFSPTSAIATVQSLASVAAGVAPGNPANNSSSADEGPSGQYYDAGCGDPNLLKDGAGNLLVQPGTVPASVYGQSAMTMINTIPTSNSGNIIIPLAYIPPSYAGKSMAIRLYDVGDINGKGALAVLDPSGTVAATQSYTYGLSLQADANSGYGQASWQPCTACGSTSGWVGPITNPYDAARSGSSPPLAVTSTTALLPIRPSSLWTGNPDGQTRYGYSNGTWLNFIISVPASYAQTYPTGGWWKVLYNVSSGGNDTTTWEVQVIGDPIHLVNPTSP